MAGDWIKVRVNLDSSPKIVAMAAELQINEEYVVGLCVKVWSWADQHSLDGNGMSVTEMFLDRLCNVTGFAAALRNVGWLTGENGNLSFPRFGEHNGQTAKARAETALRVAKHRASMKQERNANGVTELLPEKRREEKKNKPPLSPLEPNSPSTGSGWEDLKAGDLKDAGLLVAWVQRARLVDPTHENEINVIAASERAMSVQRLHGEPPKDRVAYFVSIVRDQNWKVITDDDRDRAKRRHSALCRASPTSAAADLSIGSFLKVPE